MSKEFSLISTKLELRFCRNKKKILAGNWCFHNKNVKYNDKYLLINNPWENHKIFNKDYKYIKNLINKITVSLINYLNFVHKKKFSKKFWKILVLPWLTIYLPANYYRWRIVTQALNENKKVYFYNLENLNKNTAPSDSYDFHKKIQNSQTYNYLIFRKIIFFLKKKKNIKIKNKNYKENFFAQKKVKSNNKYAFKFILTINLLLQRFFSFNKIFLERSIFRKIDNIKISINLKQIPTYSYDTFNDIFGFKNFYENEIFDVKKRNSIKLNFNCKSEFEKFLKSSIIEDIPLCFVEGFDNLFNFVKKIQMRPKKIISSYYHYFNELFKVWVAFLKEKNLSKFYTVNHGGGGYMKYPSSINFEKEISDKEIIWYKSKSSKKIQLPASKFITKKNDKSIKKFISFVEGPIHLFPSRLGFATIGNENTNSFNNFLKFYKKIDLEVKKKLIYIPKREHNINASKNLKKFIKKIQIKEPNSFNKYNQYSKLNILSYPQTTFCESIQTTPTILIYDKGKWEFNNDFSNIYKDLIKYNILFHDPIEAAIHVNKYSKNIDCWWTQKSVQNIIKKFLKDISLVSDNSIKTWVNRLKTL